MSRLRSSSADWGVGKVVIFTIFAEFIIFFIGVTFGSKLLVEITSTSPGFQFVGITYFVMGILSLLMLFITCAALKSPDLKTSVANDHCYLPLWLVMAGLGIFMLVVSSKGGGKSLPGRSYEEYSLSSYSQWMQNMVNDTENWDKFYKPTLVKNNVCSKFTKEFAQDTLEKLHTRALTPLESGCCMPSEECNFDYTSPSVWTKLENQSYSNMDCYAWDNDLNTRCFNCQSCKAGFVQDLSALWFWKGIWLIIVSGVLLLAFVCFIMPLCTGSESLHTPLV